MSTVPVSVQRVLPLGCLPQHSASSPEWQSRLTLMVTPTKTTAALPLPCARSAAPAQDPGALLSLSLPSSLLIYAIPLCRRNRNVRVADALALPRAKASAGESPTARVPVPRGV